MVFKSPLPNGQLFALLGSLILIDQLIKWAISPLGETMDWGIIRFIEIHNYGFIGGTLSHLGKMVRIVMLSTLGGYILMAYGLILYFLKNKNLALLKIGLSFFVAGIIGNTIDKTHLGFVIDFINLRLPLISSYVFNIADLWQIAGVLLIIYSLYRYYDEIWHPQESRKTYLIEPAYQWAWARVFFWGLVMVWITLTLFCYSFLKSYISPELLDNEPILLTFFFGIGVIFLLNALIAVLFAIIFSHRSVGPIRAFIQFVRERHNPKREKLFFRTGDFHRELEQLAEEIKNENQS